MPDVLTLKGTGEAVTLLAPHDVLEYVHRYMGPDTEQYIRNIVDALEDDTREIEARRDSDLDSYEASLESNSAAFTDILDYVRAINDESAKSRTNKSKIAEYTAQITKIVCDQI